MVYFAVKRDKVLVNLRTRTGFNRKLSTLSLFSLLSAFYYTISWCRLGLITSRCSGNERTPLPKTGEGGPDTRQRRISSPVPIGSEVIFTESPADLCGKGYSRDRDASKHKARNIPLASGDVREEGRLRDEP